MKTAIARLRGGPDKKLIAEISVPWSDPPSGIILAGGRIFVHSHEWLYFEVLGWIIADLPAGAGT